MASKRQDDLAKRLSARIQDAPAKGRVIGTKRSEPPKPRRPESQPRPEADPTPEAERTPTRSRRTPTRTRRAAPPIEQRVATPIDRPRRGAAGTTLRGHLIPQAVHAQATRRKVDVRARTGSRMTWDDVMRAGLGLLLDDPDQARSINSDLQQVAGSDARRRLVQATLPMEIDQRLLELQLDLNERPEPAMTLEQLWAIAVLCWLRSTA